MDEGILGRGVWWGEARIGLSFFCLHVSSLKELTRLIYTSHPLSLKDYLPLPLTSSQKF